MNQFHKTTLLGVAAILAACQQAPKLDSQSLANTVCSNSTTRLMAGQSINVGTVAVTQDEQFLCVDFQITAPSWSIQETHLAIATSPDLLPQTGSGNPQPGQFPYKHTGLNVQQDTFCIDYVAAGYSANQTLYLAAHAVVVRRSSNTIVQKETAWGEGSQFTGRNWAMYFNHTMGICNHAPVAICQDVPACPTACEDIDAGSNDPDGPQDVASIACSYSEDGTHATLLITDIHGLTASCTAAVGLSTCNEAPVALCQDIAGCPGACEDIDAGSFDPDGTGDIASVTCEYSIDGTVAVLTVTDQAGVSASCTGAVDLDACNEPPVAICKDLVTECPLSSNSCDNIDGGSYDPDGTEDISAITCDYNENGQASLTITDHDGLSSTCEATITVADASAPVPTVNSMIMMATPRDYLLHPFTLASCVAAVTDNCDDVPDIDEIGDIVSIGVDEPHICSSLCEDPGYAATHEDCFDVIIDGHSSFRLRNNKNSGGGGRVYTIVFTVHDAQGNVSPEYTCLVGVKDYPTQIAPRQDPIDHIVYP